jgi:hypothetical protein
MKKLQKKANSTLTNDQLNIMADKLVDRIEDVFHKFGIDAKKSRNHYYAACPIHDGDNSNAFNLYVNGYAYRGIWKCRTHGCERIFKKTPIGLVRALLSKKKYGWAIQGDKQAPFNEVIEWISKFLKLDAKSLEVDDAYVSKKKFINSCNWLNPQQGKKSLWMPRYSYLQTPTLDFSSSYASARGFSDEIIKKYDISECNADNREMTGRMVIPVYDEQHKAVIGCTGRTLLPQCSQCKHYHKDACPGKEEIWKYTKWRHNKGFAAEEHLFNYWYAKDHINREHSVVLVESPLSVMKLVQSGINNCLASFGAHLTDSQLNKLFQTECYTINLLYDNDEAGRLATADIKQRVEKVFNINTIEFPYEFSDPAEMTIEQIKQYIRGNIEVY